jgi:transposase
MSNFSTFSPLFIVPLADEPEEERELGAFMRLLASSGLGRLLRPKAPRGPDGGQPPYDASSLLAAILFAFSDTGGTVRDVADSCRFDLRYRYLTSDAKPGKSTVAGFISRVIAPNADAIFRGVTGSIMSAMGGSPVGEAFVDGSKFEANANKYKFTFRSRKRALGLLARAGCLIRGNGMPFPEKPEPPYSRLIGEAVSEVGRRLSAAGKDPAGSPRGRGHRADPEVRLFRTLSALLGRMLAWEETDRICGPGRNSFYKTDRDATAMCLKEDYYSGAGSNMHAAYNVQIAVSQGIIVGYYVSQDRSDSRTLPAFLGRMRGMWGAYPAAVCADAGYGSAENYSFLAAAGISCYVKYPSWEGEVTGTRPALLSLSGDGSVRCLKGFEAERVPPVRHPRFRGAVFYRIGRCRGCEYRRYCTRALAHPKAGERTFEESPEYLGHKRTAAENLLSPKGIELRVNRSIQVEGTFGIVKQDMAYDRFRRRGLAEVSAEMMLICLGANIRKYFSFLRSGRAPEFWKAPAWLEAEKPHRISCAVRRGGRSRRNLRKQPNQVARRMAGRK